MSEARLRGQMIKACAIGGAKGFLAGMDGNLSCRLDQTRLLITPSGRAKAWLTEDDLLVIDLAGNLIAGTGKVSSEVALHLMAYRVRPETQAVVHAHPPLATALTAAGQALDVSCLPELLLGLGAVPTAPYATPGTADLPAAVEPYLRDHDAVLMEHHGSLALGPDLETAWARTEKVESAARVILTARGLGQMNPLPPGEIERLLCRGGRAAPAAKDRPLDAVKVIHLPLTGEFRTEKRLADHRGEAHLVWDGPAVRRAGLLSLLPGSGFRGNHHHRIKTEHLYLARGRARVGLVEVRTGRRRSLELGPGDRLTIPPGVAHRIEALDEVLFLELCDLPYDPADDLPYTF